MKSVLATLFCLAFTVSLHGSLPGQVDDEAKGGVIYKKETILDIEKGLDIEGGVDGPRLEIIDGGPDPLKKTSLIKIRTNFERELLRSVYNL